MLKHYILFAFMFIGGFKLQAQDRLVEVNVRGTALSGFKPTNGSESNYQGYGYALEALYYLKPKIAVGFHYATTFNSNGSPVGDCNTYQQNNFFNNLDGDFGFQQYGLSTKFSTNRSRFFQAYISARLVWQENVYNYEDDYGFSIGDKGMVAGVGGGLILRISPTIGFNLFDVNYNQHLSGFEFTDSSFSTTEIQLRSGFVFNIKQRK